MYTKLIEQYENETDYNKGAQLIADALNLKMEIKGVEFKDHWKEGIGRYVFKICLKRDVREYTFDFGQSVQAGSKEPTMYDILACLQKYDVEDFDYFCDTFGFDNDSRKAYKTYKAGVIKESIKGIQIYNDGLDKLNLNPTQKALIVKVYHMTDKGDGLKDIIIMLNSFSRGKKRIKSNRWSSHHERQYEYTEKGGNEKYSHKGNLPRAHFRWNYGRRYTLNEEDLRKISLFIKPLLKFIKQ